MKSLAPTDYKSLPALDAPAAYICVIRDIDRDRYRIEATQRPEALIASVSAEGERSFGIELVSVIQTDDLATSEAALYERHHARLSSEWLELDTFQLEELRQSVLMTDAYASRYVIAGELSSATGGAVPALGPRFRPRRASGAARQSNRRAGGERAGRPLASHHYSYWQLGRRQRAPSDAVAADRNRRANSDWRVDLLRPNLIVVFAVIVTVTFIGIGMIRDRTVLHRSVSRPTSAAVATTTSIPLRQAPGSTPEGRPYLLTRSAPTYRCALRTCAYDDVLPSRTQIWVLEMVDGSPVNGSTVWLEFQFKGETAFVPISYLEPLD